MNTNAPFRSPGPRLSRARLLPGLGLLVAALTCLRPAHGLTIVPTFDSSITGHPQGPGIITTISGAIAVYENVLTDPVTVSIEFHGMSTGLGESRTFVTEVLYTDYRNALTRHARSLDDDTALGSLPSSFGNPVNGNPNVELTLPLARALGFSVNPPSAQTDGSIGLHLAEMNLSTPGTDAGKFSLFSVVSHEIDEVLGFGSALGTMANGAPAPLGAVNPEDLFRYDQNGARTFNTDASTMAYFTLDGTTRLARFNQKGNADFADWYSPGTQTPQVQDAFGTRGASPVLGVELRVLDVIGYTRLPAPIWVEFAGSCFSCGSGTFWDPFYTLYRGELNVDPGGTVIIKAGVSHEQLPLTVTKPMLLVSFGGPATIGP